jgi:NADH-quinone oxidoreductase subunit H
MMELLEPLQANPLIWSLFIGFLVLNGALLITAWSIWFERKFAGALQNRPGPTEVGPFGLLQPIADLIKMIQKENIVPADADRALFVIAPPLATILAASVLAVIPFDVGAVAADVNVSFLFVLAIGSVMVLPMWMAGWASNNKYSLLAAMRSAAQSVSYEVPLLLSAMVPVILAGSLNLGEIVESQKGYNWYMFWPPGPGLCAFAMFFMCSLAEANRIPFDIPEAGSELIGGVTVEYTGMSFGLLQLAEYLHTLVTSALCALLFLGGWEGPGPAELGLMWMVLKTLLLFGSIFWIRWSLMRYRWDQLMHICWVYLVPISLLLVAVSAVWVYFEGGVA